MSMKRYAMRTETSRPPRPRIAGVAISIHERPILEAPGHAKLDVVRYHEALAPWLLRERAPRPIAVVVRAVQNGAYEFHTWSASFPRLDRPDRIILDLDPDTALPWTTMHEAA